MLADLPAEPPARPLRHVLVGDGESPHLLKWARALSQARVHGQSVEVFAVSTRGFVPDWDAWVAPERRLALNTRPQHAGGNTSLLKQLPRVGAWLARVDADWINPHYLTSSGTLALLAKRVWRLRGRVLASAWGSDILVTPERSAALRWLTQAILRQADLCTSDSHHMSARMQALGAREVMTFPFGLEALPPATDSHAAAKPPWLFFANRGLEPIYRPQAVLELFAQVQAHRPEAQLVVANDGSLRDALQAWVTQHGLGEAVRFVGRLDAATQAQHYAAARWYLSLPASDSVAVSVLEAMAHGCVPVLSDLPANRELVAHRVNGLLVGDAIQGARQAVPERDWLEALAEAPRIAARNRQWVAEHAVFGPCVEALLRRMQAMA
ncbi:glycosyl transferase family 1 [Comamonas serinivorans]|uniref:Glycosyl transferase family 1 n=1 Tax=Comamonas serinivorans TaxID=1082851 RepID=A0A1Y0ELS7_9BURK|nr:glycosyltransferase [Comamonas serinivorans]ARU04593.1 glycosyl transferase family 1 [Comamonas serinivorans]